MSRALHFSHLRRALFASAFVVGLVTPLVGSGALASSHQAHGAASLPGTPGQYGPLTDEHLRKLMHHLMAKVDENQRSQLMEIAKRAKPELEIFEQRARQARAPRRNVLLADVPDRQALEQIRKSEMQVAQDRSVRVDQLLMEMAGVLTPQQRAHLLSELQPPAR